MKDENRIVIARTIFARSNPQCDLETASRTALLRNLHHSPQTHGDESAVLLNSAP